MHLLLLAQSFSYHYVAGNWVYGFLGCHYAQSIIYTNYVNVHLSIDKLDKTNYDTWASDIKLWLKSQDYVDHLTQCVRTVAADESSRWLKIDAQLFIVIKYTIHSSLKQFFRVF